MLVVVVLIVIVTSPIDTIKIVVAMSNELRSTKE